MKKNWKIVINNFKSLDFPDDINEFYCDSFFENKRNEYIQKYKKSSSEIDYYTNSVVPSFKKFDNAISFMEPLIADCHFTELCIKSFDGLAPGFLAELKIAKIVVDEQVKEIPACIFKDDKFLKEVTLNEGLKTIGDEAFAGCRNLKAICIPSTVNKIGSNICGNCIFLESIKVCEKNEYYISFNSNIIVNKANMQIIQGCYKSAFPNTIKSIGERAFYGLPLLKTIELPDSLVKISKKAFYGCINLEKISLPSSIQCIDDYAFSEISQNAIISYRK